jgi:diguanylate cyclase (GGDEF)-like protein
MVPLTGITSAALLGLWGVLSQRGPVGAPLAHSVGSAVALLLAVNGLVHIATTGELQQSTNIALLIVAVGCFFTRIEWLVGVAVLVCTAWALLVLQIGDTGGVVHFAFMILIAVTLAVLVLQNRARLILSNAAALRAEAQQTERLLHQSLTDQLTGVYNRRWFDQSLQNEWGRALETVQPLSLVLIDVDRFKLYNDAFGHPAGDQCLKQVAGILGRTLRRMDALSRYGGEEFAVLLPDTDLDQAFEIAERARLAVESARLPHTAAAPGEPEILTISLGVATSRDGRLTGPDALIIEADAALYQAKAQGRNRTIRATASTGPDVIAESRAING